ncbi:MAG: hypothetical protein JNM17_18860 [Archangium sp.]|nr:hypothetical protein [Archangium sp.]
MVSLLALGLLVMLLLVVGGAIIVFASRKNVTVVSLKPPHREREANPSLPSKSARKPAHTAPPGSLIRQVEDSEIEAQIRSGHLIDAIKLYREKKGVGLKEANAAVEAWRDRIRAS